MNCDNCKSWPVVWSECGDCAERTEFNHNALLAVLTAAQEWLQHLEEKGANYYDGIPGELMDAIERATDAKKPPGR